MLAEQDNFDCCPGCQSAISFLPAAATFCPRCGERLGSLLDDELEERWDDGEDAAAPSFSPIEAQRSPILLGYARALIRLGWRYEMGLGAYRNRAEARRCYDKAARLGVISNQPPVTGTNIADTSDQPSPARSS